MMYCFGLFLVIFLCYFISIFGIVVVNAVNYNKGHEGRLIDDLLVNNKYSKLERPVYDEAEALNITFKVELQQVIDLDERNQLLTTNLWLTYAWRDMNLIWDPVCDPFSMYTSNSYLFSKLCSNLKIGLGRATFFLARVGFGLPILSPGRVRATNFDIF